MILYFEKLFRNFDIAQITLLHDSLLLQNAFNFSFTYRPIRFHVQVYANVSNIYFIFNSIFRVKLHGEKFTVAELIEKGKLV